jgi:hypothetical protein
MVYTVEVPGSDAPSGVLQVDLIAGDPGDLGWASAEDTSVLGRDVVPLVAGVATMASMRPNSGSSDDVIDVPANTVYRGIVRLAGHKASTPFYFTVPDTAGTHQVYDYLTTAPTDLTRWVQNQSTFSQAGVLTTGTGTFRYYMDEAYTVAKVIASVGIAPTGASIIVDVNKNGTTIFTDQDTRPTIGAGTYTDTVTPDNISVASGDYLTVDIDQIGSSVAGSNLVVQVKLT